MPTSSSMSWPPPHTANIRRVGFSLKLGLKMEPDPAGWEEPPALLCVDMVHKDVLLKSTLWEKVGADVGLSVLQAWSGTELGINWHPAEDCKIFILFNMKPVIMYSFLYKPNLFLYSIYWLIRGCSCTVGKTWTLPQSLQIIKIHWKPTLYCVFTANFNSTEPLLDLLYFLLCTRRGRQLWFMITWRSLLLPQLTAELALSSYLFYTQIKIQRILNKNSVSFMFYRSLMSLNFLLSAGLAPMVKVWPQSIVHDVIELLHVLMIFCRGSLLNRHLSKMCTKLKRRIYTGLSFIFESQKNKGANEFQLNN